DTTLRWGQIAATQFLNPFNAGTPIETSILGEVYDNLFKMTPAPSTMTVLNWTGQRVPPAQIVDGSGNTHYFIQLCPCMFHDGVSVTATDVKFTLLNFRDAPAAAYYGYVESVVSVNVLNPHLVEVVMQGQSVSDLYNLARVPIIPEHIWDSGDNFYGQGAGRVDPAKTSLAYDPIDSGTFIGSGPFVCKSMFAPDVGRIGGGCSENADGSRGNQAMLAGGTLLLSSFTQYATHPCVMPYFALSASPNTLTIRHTQSDKSTVTVSSVNGF